MGILKSIVTHCLKEDPYFSWKIPKVDNNLVRFLKLIRLGQAFAYLIRRLSNKKRFRIYNILINKFRVRCNLVSVKELEHKYKEYLLYLTDKNGAKTLGDYLEFGVYQGASFACMYRALKDLGLDNVRLFGFDSFEGLPDATNIDDKSHHVWLPGHMDASYEYVKEVLTKEGINWNRTFLIKGFFNETLTDGLIRKYSIKKASVIMIDCVYYISTKQALDFCAPLVQDSAIIVLDDCKVVQNGGEIRAWYEFLKANPYFTSKELSSYNRSSKVFLVKRE